MTNVQQTILELRRSHNLSQEGLARVTGVAQPNIVRWERGVNPPSVSTLLKIGDALGYDVIVKFVKKEVQNDGDWSEDEHLLRESHLV